MSMIRFAEDCVCDRRYREANEIYEWLWQMSVSTDSEYGDPADLEIAGLLTIVGEIKEDMGIQGVKRYIYEQYRKKFPRHSSFLGEMRDYFNIPK